MIKAVKVGDVVTCANYPGAWKVIGLGRSLGMHVDEAMIELVGSEAGDSRKTVYRSSLKLCPVDLEDFGNQTRAS